MLGSQRIFREQKLLLAVLRPREPRCGGELNLPQLATVLRAGGWTNLEREIGPPTRVGLNDRGTKQ